MKKQVGRYEIKDELGKGGMGVVYLAHDPRLGRDVALKVLSDDLVDDPRFHHRFEREAKTIAGLEHSAIVPVYGFGEDEGQPYLVMRYMAGGSLHTRLQKGRLALGEVCQILTRLAGALDKVHEKGYIHRDIKPPNILFDEAGEAFLADFGVARLVVPGEVTVVGTRPYMAPEQRKGEDLDARTDVYPLGMVLAEMMTGSLPMLDRVVAILNSYANLPPGADQVIARAVAEKKEARYASAGELANAFAAVMEGEDPSTRLGPKRSAPARPNENGATEPVTVPPKPDPPPQILDEDGQLISNDQAVKEPLEGPNLESILAQLDAPGGGVKLRDTLYIQREADARLKRQLLKSGSTTTIHAPRQTGKTSLLMRGLHHAKKSGAKVVFFNFQSLGREQLSTPERFLRGLAGMICRQLRLDDTIVAQTWDKYRNPQQKLTYFLEDHVLPEFEGPIILAMDHADSLLQTDFYSDFFGLVRFWHDQRGFDPERWEKLNIVMVISTEPYLLIDRIDQSPFNVGLKLELADFSAAQVERLNEQHGSPVAESDFADLMALLGGQPYLTRQAFYTLLNKKWRWRDFVREATTDHGPFGAHLRRLYEKVSHNAELKKALKQIIHTSGCRDDKSCFRLLRAGLVKRSGKAYTCRCELYRVYFERKLS
ncbi:MAG: AAA-like domain-containing protein [Ardenticatenaceae bacterium]